MKYRIFLNGRKVAEILVRRGLTRSELADKIGVSPTYIWMLMNQRSAPSPELTKKIQATLRGARWDDLFRMEESATSAAL